MSERHQAEINHEAYIQKYQADLEGEHTGESALMHNGEIVAIVRDSTAAYHSGYLLFGPGNFSIKRIGASPARLGTAALLMSGTRDAHL